MGVENAGKTKNMLGLFWRHLNGQEKSFESTDRHVCVVWVPQVCNVDRIENFYEYIYNYILIYIYINLQLYIYYIYIHIFYLFIYIYQDYWSFNLSSSSMDVCMDEFWLLASFQPLHFHQTVGTSMQFRRTDPCGDPLI